MRAAIIVFIVRTLLVVYLPVVVVLELGRTLWTEIKGIPWYLWNSVCQDWEGFVNAWRGVPDAVNKKLASHNDKAT